MTRILVIDDKEMMRDSVGAMLSREGHVVVTSPGGEHGLGILADRTIDAVVADLEMPGMSGIEFMQAVAATDHDVPVILMTAYGTIATAVESMKMGAVDFITKPFPGDTLLAAVDRAVTRHRRSTTGNNARQGNAGKRKPVPEMIGSSGTMQDLKALMGAISASPGTVLITGESGTGKEVAAHWIHACSPRRDRPFIAVNCSALPTSLLESELFGHEKGSFTGADAMRKGRFELADGGTLLLDEISEISTSVQAKLLRVLQEQHFERVGSSRSRCIDVRIIATSNCDLEQAVSVGTFREDLFYRINVLPVQLPPLRERTEDIPLLVQHFLVRWMETHGTAPLACSPDAMVLLAACPWPGNIRELRNICERAAVLAQGGEISADLVRPWLAQSPRDPAGSREPRGSTSMSCDGGMTLADIERECIVRTLQRFAGHRRKTAEALGIGVRTLGLKLRKWKDLQLVSSSL